MTGTVQGQAEAQICQLMAEQEIAMRTRDAARLVSRYPPETVKFELVPPLRHTGPERTTERPPELVLRFRWAD